MNLEQQAYASIYDIPKKHVRQTQVFLLLRLVWRAFFTELPIAPVMFFAPTLCPGIAVSVLPSDW